MHSSDREALIAKRTQTLLPATLATFMSAFVAAVVTAINTGIDGDFALRWLKAWGIALPAAILAAYAFRPLASRLARALASRFMPRDDAPEP
jgi:hypothetical protein